MRVIAIKHGYLCKLRQPGDEFDAPDGLRASWFVPVEPEPAAEKVADETTKSRNPKSNPPAEKAAAAR